MQQIHRILRLDTLIWTATVICGWEGQSLPFIMKDLYRQELDWPRSSKQHTSMKLANSICRTTTEFQERKSVDAIKLNVWDEETRVWPYCLRTYMGLLLVHTYKLCLERADTFVTLLKWSSFVFVYWTNQVDEHCGLQHVGTLWFHAPFQWFFSCIGPSSWNSLPLYRQK